MAEEEKITWTPDMLESLEDTMRLHDALKSASNEELARLLIDHVWAFLAPPQADLVNEAIERLCPEINAIIAKEEGETWP